MGRIVIQTPSLTLLTRSIGRLRRRRLSWSRCPRSHDRNRSNGDDGRQEEARRKQHENIDLLKLKKTLFVVAIVTLSENVPFL